MQKPVPKIIGYDIELANWLSGVERAGGTGHEASRLLMAQIPGVTPSREFGYYSGWSSGFQTSDYPGAYVKYAPQEPSNLTDHSRKWQTNGGCIYIDSDHVEIASPEVTNAWDWVASYYAQPKIVREAQKRVNESLQEGTSVQVLACNSVGQGTSWGSHINILTTRDTYKQVFERRLHYLLWLASYQVSSCIISGLGKVGSERTGRPVHYQLSQRADFFEEIVSLNTMFRRGIINSRDESHCFPATEHARIHHIASDSNLAPVANLLKVGVLQIVLAMVEAESEFVTSSVLLDSPLDAWIDYSHDPTLSAEARTIDGASVTALDLQRMFFDAAAKFIEAGGCEGIVPGAPQILVMWGETLDMLARRDWPKLERRLDWVLKKSILEEAFSTNPGLTWQSKEAKYLDLMYSSINPDDGLFWPLVDAGLIDQVVDARKVTRFMTQPPQDTRAFTRGRLIAGLDGNKLESANWDSVGIRAIGSRGRQLFTVYMDSPLGSTARHNPALLRSNRNSHEHISPDSQASNQSRNGELPECNSKNTQSTQLVKK